MMKEGGRKQFVHSQSKVQVAEFQTVYGKRLLWVERQDPAVFVYDQNLLQIQK